MVCGTKIMSPRNGAGTAEVGRSHMDQLIARTPRVLAEPTRSGITARWQRQTPIEVLTGEYLPRLQPRSTDDTTLSVTAERIGARERRR